MLSKRHHEAINVAAFQSADDYPSWPCSRLELLARMRAVLWRVEERDCGMPILAIDKKVDLQGTGDEDCQR